MREQDTPCSYCYSTNQSSINDAHAWAAPGYFAHKAKVEITKLSRNKNLTIQALHWMYKIYV